MVAEIFAGISSFKAMLDIAKSFKDMSDSAARKTIAVKLTEQILAAQEAQATLIEKVRSLETELTRFETWETEKQRYQLGPVGEWAFAYLLKKDSAHGEPPHWACPQCYEDRKKRVLVYKEQGPPGRDSHKGVWACSGCAFKMIVSLGTKPEFHDDQKST